MRPIGELVGYLNDFFAPEVWRAAKDLIANNVVSRTPVACSFAIPAQPQGRAVDPDKILIAYRPRGGDTTLELDQVTSAEMCLPQAFYVANAEIHCDGKGLVADRQRRGVLTHLLEWLF